MKMLTFLASAVYLAAVLSFPLSDKLGGVKGLTDGYVNVTLTDTTQNITKRQNQTTLSSIMFSIDGVVTSLGLDKRGQFTQDVVTTLWNNNNKYNYIICHVNHDYTFQGTQGVDWDHYRVDISQGSYDVVVGGAGTFIREGDGGYINWAYIGYVVSRVDFGSNAVVIFNGPS